MTVSVLKPRETAVFENEQKTRYSPESITTGLSSDALLSRFTFSANATEVIDGSVTLIDNWGFSLYALRLVDGQGIVDSGSYTLENDGVVNPVSQLGVLLEDRNDSITNYSVTINGTNAADAPISDVLNFTSGGEVQYTANGPYKTVTSITGGTVTGTFAGDLLYVVPRLGALAHDIVTRGSDPFFINNNVANDPQSGAFDNKGYYAEAIDITDQEVRVSFPNLPSDVRDIVAVRVRFNTKNLAATSNGIDFIIRHSGVSYIIGNNSATSTDAGFSNDSGTFTYAIAPGTGLAWTPTQVDSIEAGVIFKGDNPTVTKQLMRIRLEVDVRRVPVGTTAYDGEAAFLEAVSGDRFDEGATDDNKYIPHSYNAASIVRFGFPDLPSEAVGVLNVKAFFRAASISKGHPNGATQRSLHCAEGGSSGSATDSVQPRGGTGLHYGRGPMEESLSGGWRGGMQTPSGPLQDLGDANGRTLNGPGNPSDSTCGNVPTAQSGRNVVWGTFQNYSTVLSGLPTNGNDWSVSEFNSMQAQFEQGLGDEQELRYSKMYTEPEWLRDPTGDTHLHLVVRDDLDDPDDTKFMVSQHSSNKQLGCNFPGIDEITEVVSIVGTVRGATSVGASKGWKIKLKVGSTTFNATGDTEYMNTSPEDKTATWAQHPTEFRPWTRAEVNTAVLIFEAQGENAFYPKYLYNMGLTVSAITIPDKIDTARRLGSEILLYQGQPVPLLRMRVPFILGDAKLVNDVAISHDAIPKVQKTLGLERWDRSLFRLFDKELDPETDTWSVLLYDLRDFLVTLVMSGQAVTKGRSFDGMSLITPGANMQFVRGSNDYQEDPFADLVQQLQANEPPTNEDGILIQNRGINRVINNAFSEGATNVFTDWSKVGLPAAGASINEDPISNFDEESEIIRSVRLTGADAPTDIYLEQYVTLPTGDGLAPEGSRHQITITHEDVTGHPLSVWLRGDPVGFSDNNFNPADDSWATGNPTWFTLPIRSTPTRDRIPAPFATLHNISQVPAQNTFSLWLRIGVRTSANQINRLYDVCSEGGTIAGGDEAMFQRTRIVSITGPVVRDEGDLFVENKFESPVYSMKRGTGFCVIETLWDTAELPVATGVKKYIMGMVINASNKEELFYDCDDEEFVYNRVIAGVTYQATKKHRAIAKGVPIRIAWRWISAEGDLGETPFSIQIYVNDERGTDGAPTSVPAQPSSVDFYLGSLDGSQGQMLDGRMRRLRITQQVLSLDRIKKLR
ncbi:MAG: hypothetical protein GY896_23015 [Gammaproteobacteria bacterium]|nr:hypothetical protein [Gammaproteobacteria bacterium]